MCPSNRPARASQISPVATNSRHPTSTALKFTPCSPALVPPCPPAQHSWQMPNAMESLPDQGSSLTSLQRELPAPVPRQGPLAGNVSPPGLGSGQQMGCEGQESPPGALHRALHQRRQRRELRKKDRQQRRASLVGAPPSPEQGISVWSPTNHSQRSSHMQTERHFRGEQPFASNKDAVVRNITDCVDPTMPKSLSYSDLQGLQSGTGAPLTRGQLQNNAHADAEEMASLEVKQVRGLSRAQSGHQIIHTMGDSPEGSSSPSSSTLSSAGEESFDATQALKIAPPTHEDEWSHYGATWRQRSLCGEGQWDSRKWLKKTAKQVKGHERRADRREAFQAFSEAACRLLKIAPGKQLTSGLSQGGESERTVTNMKVGPVCSRHCERNSDQDSCLDEEQTYDDMEVQHRPSFSDWSEETSHGHQRCPADKGRLVSQNSLKTQPDPSERRTSFSEWVSGN